MNSSNPESSIGYKIIYRGKNYIQRMFMSPPDALSKTKALEKYRCKQSLEDTNHFIEKLEKELARRVS